MSFLPRVSRASCTTFVGPRRAAAFSLVEVVLALGVMSFALVALVGILPVGMTTLRAGIDAAVKAQITQQITTLAQQTEFAALGEIAGPVPPGSPRDEGTPIYYYYDDEGTRTERARSLFTAAVRYRLETPLPSATPTATQTVATLWIDIYHSRGLFDGPVPRDSNPTVVAIHLADCGQRL